MMMAIQVCTLHDRVWTAMLPKLVQKNYENTYNVCNNDTQDGLSLGSSGFSTTASADQK